LRDALVLGTAVMQQLIQLGCLGVYVTFVDELASLNDATVSMVSTVAPENPALRTYKVIRTPADGLAYAAAIAEKYGLSYGSLRRRIAR
jgi:adenine/guanine phosphoribosyltransferase-like PRPP-binding protein